jgi:hypothetical protein
MGQVRLVSVKLILCARATTGASYSGFKIDQIGGITAPYPPTRSDAGAGRSIEEAATAAANKIQFNGVGGLRAYISFTRIGDQSSR